MSRMQFSLVVTCYNEMKSLARWRGDIEAQTRPPDEIVIVDSQSNDGTTEALKTWASTDARVRVIVEKCKPARGHNIGNEAARYEHLVSTDMGVRIHPKWFQEIVQPFERDSEVQVVAGSYEIEPVSVVSAAARAEFFLEDGGRPVLGPGFIPGNRSMAYTREVWRELGGLPEDLSQYADDSVFGRQILQAGYKMAFAPEALVYWSRPERLGQFWKEAFNYGRGDGEAMIKVPIAFRLYRRNLLPRKLVPLCTALRFLQSYFRFTAAARAVAKMDVSALLLMPVLLLGKGYNFGKGFLVGEERGRDQCVDCRKRLAPAPRTS